MTRPYLTVFSVAIAYLFCGAAQASPETFESPATDVLDVPNKGGDELTFIADIDYVADASCTYIFLSEGDASYRLVVGREVVTGVIPGPNIAENRDQKCNAALAAANASLARPADRASVQHYMLTGGYGSPMTTWVFGAPYVIRF